MYPIATLVTWNLSQLHRPGCSNGIYRNCTALVATIEFIAIVSRGIYRNCTALAAAVKFIAIVSRCNDGHVEFIAITPPWLQQCNLSQLYPAAMLVTWNLSQLRRPGCSS
jgi:hypothetical protein